MERNHRADAERWWVRGTRPSPESLLKNPTGRAGGQGRSQLGIHCVDGEAGGPGGPGSRDGGGVGELEGHPWAGRGAAQIQALGESREVINSLADRSSLAKAPHEAPARAWGSGTRAT